MDTVEAVSLTGESLECPDFPSLPFAVDGVTPINLGPADAPVLCGGLSEGDVYRKECFVVAPGTNTWELLANMLEARTEYGVAQIDENTFFITGELESLLCDP